MNRLKGTRCYLAGAMDRVADGGIGWRRDVKDQLSDLGIQWLDPCCKPINIGLEDEESRRRRHAAKMRGDFDLVARDMRAIRCVDLRMVDICDFLIVNIDLDVHATGSYEELFLANRMKKPTLVHVEQGLSRAPDWLFGTLPLEHLFGEWMWLKIRLRNVAQHPGKIEDIDKTGRWYFFNWTGDEQC